MKGREIANTEPASQQFETLVQRIFQAKGFGVEKHLPRGDAGYDFDGQLGDDKWAIEVKYYRTERAQPGLIESAALRVVHHGIRANASRVVLVVSCVIPAALRIRFEESLSITILDRNDLRRWAAGTDVALADELDALVEAGPSVAHISPARPEIEIRSPKPLPKDAAPLPEAHGAALCAELATVKKGKEGWAKYEEVCARILQYLFPNDLHGWHKQKRTDDGLNRFDFICRVRPSTEFWCFLIDHLNSRYVLFEFKNYRSKIKQVQILTTEKYLLERGLRRAAIIMTRVGAENDAIKMTQGAMREHGKLMLIINDTQVCKMLHMKDRGEDPTDSLFETADDFLLRLPR